MYKTANVVRNASFPYFPISSFYFSVIFVFLPPGLCSFFGVVGFDMLVVFWDVFWLSRPHPPH